MELNGFVFYLFLFTYFFMRKTEWITPNLTTYVYLTGNIGEFIGS